jgi:hypothetical protein
MKQVYLMIFDKYSECGPGYAIKHWTDLEYDREVAAWNYLRDRGQKGPFAIVAVESIDHARKEARHALGETLFNTCH